MTRKGDGDVAQVLAANDRFYEVISSLDLEEMERVWSNGDEIRCIHPGWDALGGRRKVLASWQAIFSSSPDLNVEPDEVEVTLYGDLAWVHCLEKITSSGDDDDSTSFARTTNLYIRNDGIWLLVLHHASPIPGPQETASGTIH
jgi:ketosteroid isomerase-like protein